MAERSALHSDTDRLQQRNRELSILNAIARALNAEVNLDRALQAALGLVAELLGLETGWVWLLHQETDESYLAASQNLPPALADNPARMEGPCFCLDTFRAGDLEGAANVNVVTCSRLRSLVDGTDGLRYHASIPLYAHGRRLGVLNVASRNWRQLSDDDLRLLYTVGDLLGIAVERAKLYEQSTETGVVLERNRLARELHDTLAQGLTAITLQIETAEAFLASKEVEDSVRQALRIALELSREQLEEVRRSVLDLRAAPLEGKSLPEALEDLVAGIERDPPLDATFERHGGVQPLSQRVEVGLYRIAQEALSNAVQHADAKRVVIRLTYTPQRVQLAIDDDGSGFDPGRVSAARFGLRGIKERARLLGGRLQIESEPGSGTSIDVLVELEDKP